MLTMSLLILAFLFGIGSDPLSIQRLIFFQQGADLFADFINPMKWVQASYFTTGYAGAKLAFYPAMPLLCFYPFTLIATGGDLPYLLMSIFVFLLIASLSLAFILYENKTGSKLKRIYIVFLLFFSGVFLTSLERGNIVFYSTAALFCFLTLYKNDKKIWRELALVALAIAASIKIYPAIFGILLLLEKRYKEAFRAFIYTALISFIPFFIMPGGFSNLIVYFNMVKKLTTIYANNDAIIKFGFNGLLLTISIFYSKLNFLLALINPFKYISFVFSIIGVFYIEKFWKKILLLSILTITLPNPSYIYTCLNLFFPLILFLNENEHRLFDIIYLILIIIILSPFQYATANGLHLTIIFANICILTMQLFLCIEGIQAYYQYNRKSKDQTIEKRAL